MSQPTERQMRANYTRIVCTDEGNSAFEDGALLLSEQEIASGVPPVSVGNLSAAAGAVFMRSDGFDSEPHPAPRQQWVMMLRGSIEITVSDGSRRRFGPGDLLLAADTHGTGHVTSTVGEPPHEAVVVPHA